MAEVLSALLIELRLENKLLAVTADNATNNERLLSESDLSLTERLHDTGADTKIRALCFRGADCYIRCTANVLSLIVTDVLSMLKAVDHTSANAACDLISR